MASKKNDALRERTVEGPLNYYDGHACKLTASDKGLAARLGGQRYNILNQQDEHYFADVRSDDHYVNRDGHHTTHFFGGGRKRKFGERVRDSSLVRTSLLCPAAHPRERALEQRRVELQLAQTEHCQSWSGFQNRAGQLFPPRPPKRYDINNHKYANELEMGRSKISGKTDWLQRRGEAMEKSASAPSLSLTDPSGSLDQAIRQDARKEAHQRQTESAHFAPWRCANTYANSMDSTPVGKALSSAQQRLSVQRVENHDFSVTRKNNHYSGHDRLTRTDPYFMRPREGASNSSVKYDIISNEVKWFKY
jgi:hypothetical protein